MAESRDHLERLIFEVHGAEKGAEMLEKLRKQEEKYAQSLKGLKKQAQETAKAEVKAAKDVEQAQKRRAEVTKKALMGIAGAFALVAARSAEAVAAYAKMDAAEGRLQRAIGKTTDAASRRDAAFKRAQATFRDWERFGVSAERQTQVMVDLTEATGNYEQSLSDVSLAIDISAAKGIDFERAAEAVRKARQGEVEVLKELGVLTKDETEALGRMESQAQRSQEAIVRLTQAFGGGATGTEGLQTTLEATQAKLERTEQLVGGIAAKLVEDGTGLIAAMSQFVGIVDEGQHPLDVLNDKLEKLAGHAENGDWQKLAGVLLLGNPMTMAAGLALLDANSQLTPAAADLSNLPGGTGALDIKEVPEPVIENFGGGAKKAKAKRRGGGAAASLEGFIGDFGGGQMSLEEAAGAEAQALQEREDRRRTYLNNIAEAERQHADEVAQIYQDQADFKRKLDEDTFLRERQARQQATEAAWAGAEAAAGLATSFIKDEGGKAIIQGGMETARAIAAGAAGNIPGAIGHGAAAAQFFAVAAQAGMSAGSKKGGGGGGGAAGGSMASDRERVSLQSEQSRSRESRAPQTQVVNVYSTFGPSPQQSRELVDAVEREMRNRTTTRRM